MTIPTRVRVGSVIIGTLIFAAAMAFGLAISAAHGTTPAKPAWLHIGQIHRYRDCAPHHHGAAGVFVWQKPEGNGTAALHCKNGKTFLS